MLGFDRGGAYAQVFRHCREQGVHWVTYRRAPLAVPVMLPVITTVTIAGRQRQITWTEETVDIKDYGQARQLTLSEHGRVVLQILTSDFDACPAEILAWLRWRQRGQRLGRGNIRHTGHSAQPSPPRPASQQPASACREPTRAREPRPRCDQCVLRGLCAFGSAASAASVP
jgi:hypothetical protein